MKKGTLSLEEKKNYSGVLDIFTGNVNLYQK